MEDGGRRDYEEKEGHKEGLEKEIRRYITIEGSVSSRVQYFFHALKRSVFLSSLFLYSL